jgi:hypothetical protein
MGTSMLDDALPKRLQPRTAILTLATPVPREYAKGDDCLSSLKMLLPPSLARAAVFFFGTHDGLPVSSHPPFGTSVEAPASGP